MLKASLDSKELDNKIDIIEYFTSESNEKLLSIKPDGVISLTLDYTIMNIPPIKRETSLFIMEIIKSKEIKMRY